MNMPQVEPGTADVSSARPAADRDEIDRVLKLRRMAQVKSCYPCRNRKVKCDQAQPCKTCQKRGYPDICVYGIDAPNSRRTGRISRLRRASQLVESAGQQEQQVGGLFETAVQNDEISIRTHPTPSSNLLEAEGSISLLGHSPVPESASSENTRTPLYAGSSSVLAVFDAEVEDSSDQMRRQARPVLGLANTLDISPFAKPKTPRELWLALLKVVPKHHELLRFSPSNGSPIYPLSPILADSNFLENEFYNYSQVLETDEFRNSRTVSTKWITKDFLSNVALLLAVLASGAHYSGIQPPQKRLELCLDFIQRAFETLRLANYALHPTLSNLQALLIIGSTLQDCGQSDGSWVLLGTTVRLAQALGLHTQKRDLDSNNATVSRSGALWDLVVRQDCLLSMTYGRPAMVSRTCLISSPATQLGQVTLSIVDIMRCVSHVSLEMMDANPPDYDKRLALLVTLENCYSRAAPHLRSESHCASLQQHFERLTILIHLSFIESVICRPALTRRNNASESPNLDILRTRARRSLVATSKRFLEFQAVSLIPIRTWSITHSVLSSTILLCVWWETRDDPETRMLQHRVVEAFSRAAHADEATGIDAGQSHLYKNSWLSTSHVMALVALQDELQKAPGPDSQNLRLVSPRLSETTMEQPQTLTQVASEEQIGAEYGMDQDYSFNFSIMLDNGTPTVFDEYPWNQTDGTDPSPLDYLDTIMKTTFE